MFNQGRKRSASIENRTSTNDTLQLATDSDNEFRSYKLKDLKTCL